jgi:ethanolamine utilization protein EutA (predicted chaperonin)
VETGAVIITGETAKKKNADEILRRWPGWPANSWSASPAPTWRA